MPKTVCGPGKRMPLGVRTTPEIRAKMEAAAKASGRSLAQEIEFRLEQSFDREATVRAVLAEQRMPYGRPSLADAYGSTSFTNSPYPHHLGINKANL